MCSDLVLKFPTENCSDATFTISENFNVGMNKNILIIINIIIKSVDVILVTLNWYFFYSSDFIIPNDINQTKPDKLPAKINPTLPSSCKDLSVEYKCSGE